MNNQLFDEDAIELDDSDGSTSRTLRNRNIANKTKNNDSVADKRIRKLVADSKFLSDFDPEKSTRERRKLKRKCYTPSAAPRATFLFDDKGRYRSNGADICDCLDSTCPGCHFPCPNCKSTKCGTSCRVNRKWAYESIEHDGKDLVLKNKNIENK